MPPRRYDQAEVDRIVGKAVENAVKEKEKAVKEKEDIIKNMTILGGLIVVNNLELDRWTGS